MHESCERSDHMIFCVVISICLCWCCGGKQVLGMVRFPLMDAGLLSDVIKNHEVTQVCRCCMDFFNDRVPSLCAAQCWHVRFISPFEL